MVDEEDDGMHCEECGKPFKDEDEIISHASGIWHGDAKTGGPSLGDHFIMHAECPE